MSNKRLHYKAVIWDQSNEKCSVFNETVNKLVDEGWKVEHFFPSAAGSQTSKTFVLTTILSRPVKREDSESSKKRGEV